MVDVRSYVRELRVGDERSLEALREAGIVGDVVALEMTLLISQTGSAKVAEVVQAVTEREGVEHLAVRLALLADGTTPLDVTRFRKVSALLYLSDASSGGVEGGETLFAPRSHRRWWRPIPVQPACGAAVIFDSRLYHRALPTRAGVKVALLMMFV